MAGGGSSSARIDSVQPDDNPAPSKMSAISDAA
jgi:hypothetical protein